MVLTNIRYSIVRRRSSCQGATRELVRRRKERIEIVGRQIYKLLSVQTSKNAPIILWFILWFIGLQTNDHWLLHFCWDCEWPLISSFTQEGRVGGLPWQKSDIHGFCATGGGAAAQAKPVKAEPPKLLSGRAPLAWVLLGFTINLRCDRHRCKKCGKISISFFLNWNC